MKPPLATTRVTEHIEEIIEFVKGIIAKGYGYSTKSGVYFDSTAFTASKYNHQFKMAPIVPEPEEGWSPIAYYSSQLSFVYD